MRGRVSRGTVTMRFGAVLALSGMAAGPATGAPSDVGDGGVPAFYAWSGALPGEAGVVLAEAPLPDAFSVPAAGKAVRILYTARDGIERGKRNNCRNRSNTDHQFSEHGSLLPERAPNR